MLAEISPTEKQRVYSAVRRLSALPDFQHFLRYLEDSLSDRDKANRSAIDHLLSRSQGAALAFEAILKLVEEATKQQKIA